MADSSQNLPDWKTRLKAELSRDKKKTVILLGLLLVAAVVGGRLFIKSMGPDSAGAATIQTVSSSGSQTENNAQASNVGLALSDPMTRERNSQQIASYISKRDPQIDRDIFHADMGEFQPTEENKASQVKPEKKPEEPNEDQLRRARIRAEAKSLSLQSTISGPSATAIINGQVVRFGQTIRGFKVIEVSAQSCALSKEGVDVVLEIKSRHGGGK